jgi:LPXTG-motif cell wall-anchored protein
VTADKEAGMKWLFYVLGVLLAVIGIIWILQGTDVLKTGFMAGHMQYALLGLIALIAGVALFVLGSRRGRVAG